MSVIIVRYAELGLKSRTVRRHFETMLRDNILSRLAADGVEALLSSEEGRFYVEADNIDKAVDSLRRIFGVASISVAETCGSFMEEICASAASYSRGRILPNQSFAVRPRREGTHPYTSVDIGREVGAAVFLANEDLGVCVDLSHPDFTLFVEVRGPRAYLFDKYIPGPGGLPMGSQGKVLARVTSDQDALAAWLMMRRGCKVLVIGQAHPLLKRYDHDLSVLPGDVDENLGSRGVLGLVLGLGMEDFEGIKRMRYSLPVYHPLIGMDKKEIERRLNEMV